MHQDVHRGHFDESATDPEETREHPGGGARSEPGSGAVDAIPIDALVLLVEVHAAQVQALHEGPFPLPAPIGPVLRGLCDPDHRCRGIEHDDSERQEEIDTGDEDADDRPRDCAEGRPDLQEHREAQVREMVPDVDGGGSG